MTFDPATAKPDTAFDPSTAAPEDAPPVRSVLSLAVKQNPDQAARANALGKQYGVPQDVVLRNLQDVEFQAAVDKADERLKTSPKLAAAMRKRPDIAPLAHDDIEPLAEIERTMLGTLGDVGVVAVKGAVGLPQAFTGLASLVTGGHAGRLVESMGIKFEDAQTILDSLYSPAQQRSNQAVKEAQGFIDTLGAMLSNPSTIATAVGESAPQMIGGAAVGRGLVAALPKLAPWLAAAMGEGVMGAGAAAEQMRSESDDGLLGVKQTAAATLSGVGTAVFGAAGGRLAQRLGLADIDTALVQRGVDEATAGAVKKGFISSIAKAGISEGVFEELPQSIQEQMWQNWAADRPLGEGVGKAAAQGLLAGMAMGGGFQAAQAVGEKYNEYVGSKAQADTSAEQLADLLKTAGSALLRERSPEQFRELMGQMSDGAVIHVDGAVLNQLTPEVLAALPESVRNEIATAAAIDTTVAIPVADVLTVVPGTPLEQVLVENARMTPDAESQASAKAAAESQANVLMQQAERVMQQAADQEQARNDYETVRSMYAEQLKASGRYRPAVAETMPHFLASFFTAYGSRLGLSAVEMQARYPVHIVGEATSGGQTVMGQGKPGEITVEGYHFSKEDRPVISTALFGTGLQGSSREEYLNAADKRLAKRAYFYADKGTGITPESGVGGRAHRAQLTNVYDSNLDPLGLKKGPGGKLGFESRVLDAGFSGYLDRLEGTQPGQVIMLGDQMIQPEILGPQSRIETGKRVPAMPVTEPQWTNYATGTPAEMQAQLERMQAKSSWQAYDMRVEGNALQYRKKQVLEQKAQKPGKPVPTAVDAVANVNAAFELANGQQFKTNRDLKLALQERVLEALKAGKINLEDFNAGAEQYLVRVALMDAEIALETNPNAVGWYNEKVTKALRLVALVHPEIQTDPQAKFAFVWAMAVTSNGLKVDKNFELAEVAYSTFKATGKMPTNIQAGQAQAAINNGLALFNEMLAKHGFEALQSFMTTKATVKEIQAFSGLEVGGENLTTEVYGSAILGPKIGNGFFSNLYGRFEQLTMDRWLMRTWGRWTGTLIETNPEQVRAKRVQLRALIQGLDKDQKKAFETIIKRKLTVGDTDAVALAIWKASQKPINRARMAEVADATDGAGQARLASIMGPLKKGQKRISFGDELRKVGNSLTKYNDGQKEAPSGPPERNRIRKVFGQALAQLQARYPALTMSDLQALLWYPEKRLYDAAKEAGEGETGYEDDAAPDYANAAAKLAREKGVPDEDIARTIEEVDNELRATDRAAGAGRTAGAEAPTDEAAAGGVREPGGVRGGAGLLGQQAAEGLTDEQRTGDRGGRYSSGGLAPLEGAPTVAGATGPDPRLVAVAEQYAASIGVDLRRQARYAEVDPERAARIAAAYEAMEHAPNDPAVREAYDNLAQQTLAQYLALKEAGYQFYLVDETNDPYAGNPWNAMRDLRANQTMGVFATEAGFGSSDADVSGNPLLADTGLEWGYGSPDGPKKRVLFNDLFRAVHDAFGHGLEGAGFRAQGEENAWQAHVRLFTGSAVGAITSETRGQNSWLNYGPHGEKNRTAKVEDTVFADQKTGLMPLWTWTEGRVEDEQGTLQQQARGTFNPATLELVLNPNANLSTFFHETGHFFLEVLADVASQPNAPTQIVEDMNTFLKWAGIADLQTWNNLDLDGKRAAHERWAESIEQYVMEGRAPSVELQPLMRRFATWLKSVYGSIQKFLAGKPDAEGMQVNDDIRRVMDRMLATDEQIAQANAVAGLVPDLEADAAAAERLNKRSMADLKWQVRARDQAISKLRKEAAAIEKDIRQQATVEVDQAPEMRAKAALDALRVDPEHEVLVKQHKAARKEAETAARAEVKAALLAENPDAKGLIKGQLLAKNRRDIDNKVDAAMIKWGQANPAPARRFSPTDADAATIADSFGFEGVDAMLQAIDAFGSRADAIDGLTQQRMLEEHGDLIDDRAIQQAANEAVHNEARARSLATELRTQREMLNPRADTGETNAKGQKITVNALVEAAKQFAAKVVGGTAVADLRGKAWQHTAAERRASKRWTEATSAGKTEEAVKAKQDQMLNHAAAKAALDAQAEVKKITEFFARVARGNDEKVVKGGRDADIVNAARAVLAAYGMETGTTKRAADYLETVKANDPDTYNAIAPMVDAAVQNAQLMTALTVDELRMLNEHIGALWYLAKRSRQSEVDGDLLDRDDLADELFARMEAIGIPNRVPGEGQAVTRAEERGLFLKQGIAFLRRVEQWAEGLDGKYGGPFLRYVFQPVKDAADRYRADRIAYRKKLQALVDNLAPVVGDSVIDAPELGYKFGTPGSTAGTAMNEILHAILHTGNPSNKRKLLLGRGWATEDAEGNLDTSRWGAFITRLANEGKLQSVHYDFVQGVWDLLEDTKPLAQKAHRDVFGRYFDEVTAESFADPWGQARRGGYVPAQVDSALVKDNALKKLAEEENASMAFAFPQPAKGFTMSRVEGYNRPLKLDLRTLSQHLDKVLLFSHMSAPVRDVRKLLTDKKVSQPLTRIQPAALESMLQPWLQRSAQQIVETPIVGSGKWARIPGLIRARAGAALMFANVSNAIQQVTGLSTAAVRVKPAHLMRAVAQYVAHPVKFSQAVWGASPYMDDRAKNEVAVMNEQMQDILIRPGVYERAQNWSMRHAYFLQTALDNVLSPIVWSGAFNQALAEGMSDSDAIKFADSTVRQTQGSTLPEDVSRFETGPAYARAFTQFVGYFNMMANTNGTALKQIADEVGLKKGAGRAFNVVMLGFLAPIWAAEAIATAFRGGPDDEDDDGYLDDWLAAVFGFGTIKGLLAQVPIAGQFGVAAMNRFNGNPMDDRVSLSPAISLLESSVGAPESVYGAIVEDGSAQKAVRDVATLVSVATGVPVYGLARPVGYLTGIADDRIEPTGPVDFARGLITGTASPDSKQR